MNKHPGIHFLCSCGLDWPSHHFTLRAINDKDGRIDMLEFVIVPDCIRFWHRLKLALNILLRRGNDWHGAYMCFETACYFKQEVDNIMSQWTSEELDNWGS